MGIDNSNIVCSCKSTYFERSVVYLPLMMLSYSYTRLFVKVSTCYSIPGQVFIRDWGLQPLSVDPDITAMEPGN